MAHKDVDMPLNKQNNQSFNFSTSCRSVFLLSLCLLSSLLQNYFNILSQQKRPSWWLHCFSWGKMVKNHFLHRCDVGLKILTMKGAPWRKIMEDVTHHTVICFQNAAIVICGTRPYSVKYWTGGWSQHLESVFIMNIYLMAFIFVASVLIC